MDVGAHASALIAENVFDFNRHAIAANGDSFGYDASRNLVLKGGGYHGGAWNTWTHQFDVHGNAHSALPTIGCWIKDTLCFWCKDCPHPSTYDRGDASHDLMFAANAFQYRRDNAIKIRGRPRRGARIEHNVFPHDGLESDRGDDAIALQTNENVDLGPGNIIKADTFGEYYSQCDFDADGIDDLFLATGATWWYSSSGKYQWSFLNTSSKRQKDLRFGYFDDDDRCDVLGESGGSGRWVISIGGTGQWKPLEQVWQPEALEGVWKPLKDVQFGRFDPGDLSGRRRTTHAFHRDATSGEWRVKKLSEPASDWEYVGGSSFPMSELRFGDFTGDRVTDVLAVVDGRWAYSESARKQWHPLNRSLGDPVAGVVIANMDSDDNVDDILRLEQHSETNELRLEMKWWRSKNGVDRWREFKRYSFIYEPGDQTVSWADKTVPPGNGFAGHFRAAPGGGTLVIDQQRFGHFFSSGSAGVAEWTSVFPY